MSTNNIDENHNIKTTSKFCRCSINRESAIQSDDYFPVCIICKKKIVTNNNERLMGRVIA